MENQNKNTLMIVGVIASVVLSSLTLGLVIFFIMRNAAPMDDSPAITNMETSAKFISKGFIGMRTSSEIKEEAGFKVVELRGHASKTDIPAFEPVAANDKDVKTILIGGNTKITKITKGKPGEAPSVEEISFDAFTSGPDKTIYLATYELSGSDVIQFEEPASLLEIYVGFVPARQ